MRWVQPAFLLMSSENEAQLIARCRKGDSSAWDELFDLHYAATGRFIFQLSSNLSREDTEEICQETFLSVIDHIESFRGASQVQTWIFRVAVNKTRDYLEHQKAAKRGGGQSPVPLLAENPETGAITDPPDPLPGPDSVLLHSERAREVGRALEKLGDPCSEIIELRYFGDLSYEEIASGLKLNPKTVSSRLSKCLDRLGEIIKTAFSREDSRKFPVE